jgi:hypothetical protein
LFDIPDLDSQSNRRYNVRRSNLALSAAAGLALLLGWTQVSQLEAQESPFRDSTNYADSAYAALSLLSAGTASELTALGLNVALPEPAPSSRGSHVAKGALIGGGVGLALGIAVGIAYSNQECDPLRDDCGELGLYAPLIGAGITVAGVVIGTVVGLTVPAGDSDETTGADPGGVTLALISSGRSLGVAASLRF